MKNSLLTICLTFISLSTVIAASNIAATNVHGGEIHFEFSPGRKWRLDPRTETSFKGFLNQERQKLLHELAGLDFPEKFVPTEVMSYIDARSSNYKNRSISCSFLERIRSAQLTSDSLKRFQGITQNGTVCIPADLPSSSQAEWTESLINFLWSDQWISINNEQLSMKELLRKNLGSDNFIDPSLKILSSPMIKTDAYGFGLSKYDLNFIATHPALSNFFDVVGKFDPNKPTSIGNVGTSMFKEVSANPFSDTVAGRLVVAPTIFITPSWAPQDLVELLVHEYGHVVHASKMAYYGGSDSDVIVLNDQIQDEAAAESFAWMILRGLYSSIPEVEVLHILKLQFMGQLVNLDPHFIGAASVYTQFHQPVGSSLLELMSLLSAQDFSLYLKNSNATSLIDDGPRPTVKISSTYESKAVSSIVR